MQENNVVEEYEEVLEQDDYDDYEDELEYVEIKGSEEEINNRKKLYTVSYTHLRAHETV